MSAPFVSLEQLLLFAAVRLGSEAHGLAIRREVTRTTGRDVSPGAVYTTMDRLEGKGFIESELKRTADDGRERKFYRVRPEGAAALREGFEALSSLASEALPQVHRLAEERS